MGKLEEKIALITGGSSGIGLATAKQFVHEGAHVFMTGRREPELAAAVKEIGSHVTGVHGDVSNLGDLDRLYAQIKREKGKLDVVFANAGVATYAPFGEITEEHYDALFNINVKGLLFTVQKALPLLPDGASIILNASIVASKGFPANSVYSATKAVVRSFARTWTTDLKDRRIRVNAVSPGFIDTPGLSELLASSETGQQRWKMLSNSVLLGRFGTPDEIAKAVVFLASDDSSYITGTELFVDGGIAQVQATLIMIEGYNKMKKNLHPTIRQVVFKDVSCDVSFLGTSTMDSTETITWEDGKSYPLIKVEISSASHPFFTGKQRVLDSEGRIDRFKKKYGKK
jgi:ribosomal protein L31